MLPSVPGVSQRSQRSQSSQSSQINEISQTSPHDHERWGEYWRFTPQSVQRRPADAIGAESVQVRGHGNVLAATGFLQGLACVDLIAQALDHHDGRCPVLATAHACKAGRPR